MTTLYSNCNIVEESVQNLFVDQFLRFVRRENWFRFRMKMRRKKLPETEVNNNLLVSSLFSHVNKRPLLFHLHNRIRSPGVKGMATFRPHCTSNGRRAILPFSISKSRERTPSWKLPCPYCASFPVSYKGTTRRLSVPRRPRLIHVVSFLNHTM